MSSAANVAERAYVPVLAAGAAVPDTPLIDEAGHALSLRARGRTSIVSFAYTRCPDPQMCSLVTAKFSRLQRLLADTNIRLVEITLDPEHDRPSVLAGYARASGARPERWTFATGSPADIATLSQRFGILSEREPNGTIGHTEAVAIVSQTGVLQTLADGNAWPVDAIAAQARDDAGLSSNPISRLPLTLLASVSAACGGRSGGVPLFGALATFATLALVFAYFAVRIFAAALFDWS